MTDKENSPNPENGYPSDWDAEDIAISMAMDRISVPSQAVTRTRSQLRAAAQASLAIRSTAPTAAGEVDTAAALTSPKPAEQPQQPPFPTIAGLRRVVLRRRFMVAALAMAASLAFLLLYMRSQPMTENQLASFCVEQLEVISAQLPQWQAVRDDAAIQLEPLMRNLNQRLTLVGSKQHLPGNVAKSCTLWKFDTGGGKFLYVFDFEQSRQIRDIPSRFRIIKQSSSSWSLAALQQGDRLFVVAIEGNIAEYIQSLEYA